jgi:hypothetical protein
MSPGVDSSEATSLVTGYEAGMPTHSDDLKNYFDVSAVNDARLHLLVHLLWNSGPETQLNRDDAHELAAILESYLEKKLFDQNYFFHRPLDQDRFPAERLRGHHWGLRQQGYLRGRKR